MAVNIQAVKSTLEEKLARTRELYKEKHIEEAGKMFGDILPIMVNSLASIAGVEVDDDDDSYVSKITALNDCGFISQEDTERLTKLRRIRNNFIHYYDIMMGNDEEQKGYLQKDIKNFEKHIAFTEDCINWFIKKAENPVVHSGSPAGSGRFSGGRGSYIDYLRSGTSGNSETYSSSGTYNNHETQSDSGLRSFFPQGNSDGYSTGGQRAAAVATAGAGTLTSIFTSYIPFIFCTIIAMAVNIFYKPETIAYTEKLINGNQTPLLIGFLAFLTILFVFCFDISFSIAAGVAFSIMARQITGSDVASLLACMTGVLLTIGLSERLRRTMAIVSYSLVLLVCWFIAWQMLSERQINNGVELDGYTKVIKVLLPMLGFIAVAIILRLTFARNFRLFGAFLGDGVPWHMAVAVIPAAILGFMYRSTWVKGIVLLTRDFYDSKLIFWTIHIALILVIFKIYDVLVESGRIPPVNLLRVALRVFVLAGIAFTFLYALLRRAM